MHQLMFGTFLDRSHMRVTILINSRWLYTLFLMMDANFRARCKDRGLEETQLAPGWAYFVEESKYQAHLKARADDRPEVRH